MNVHRCFFVWKQIKRNNIHTHTHFASPGLSRKQESFTQPLKFGKRKYCWVKPEPKTPKKQKNVRKVWPDRYCYWDDVLFLPGKDTFKPQGNELFKAGPAYCSPVRKASSFSSSSSSILLLSTLLSQFSQNFVAAEVDSACLSHVNSLWCTKCCMLDLSQVLSWNKCSLQIMHFLRAQPSDWISVLMMKENIQLSTHHSVPNP